MISKTLFQHQRTHKNHTLDEREEMANLSSKMPMLGAGDAHAEEFQQFIKK